MSASNCLALNKSPERSFIYIRNRTAPNVEPWGTHTSMSVKEEACLLSTTLCFLFLEKLNKFTMLSDMPLCLSLRIMKSCHKISNDLKIVINLMIYDIFFKQRRTRRYKIYHLLLICHMDIFSDHIISVLFVNIRYRYQKSIWILWNLVQIQ